MSADDAQLSHGLVPGSEVRGYRIMRALGAGGFGITYLAEHIDIGNRVAVKEFLPAGIAARSNDGVTVRPVSQGTQQDFAWGLDRFRQEARTLGTLDHPNIVRVLNFVQANGTAYVVMDYVEGESLGARLNRTVTLPPAEVAALVPGLFAGLEAVHRAGLLHRDIKPDNVIVRTNGVPVLIDFGAARQALGAHSRSLTTVLSEGYAPYEQYDPHGNQGTWTDIYALGGLLYRCVTGEKPVPAPRRIDARVKGKPDPLAPVAERARGPYGPGLLGAIDAALAVLETERPPDVAAMRARLGATQPVAAAPGTTAPRSSKHAGETLLPDAGSRSKRAEVDLREDEPSAPPVPRRGRRVALAATLLLLLGGGATAGYVAFSERDAEQQRQAELQATERKRREAEEAERQQREDEARRTAEAERKRREAEAEEARKRREAEEARRKQQEDEARRTAEAEAERKRREAEEARRKQQEDESRRVAEAEAERKRREADEAQRRQQEEETRRRAQEEERRNEEEIKRARDDVTSGTSSIQSRDYDEAIRLISRAIESRRLSGSALSHAYNERGRAWHFKQDYDRAVEDYTRALEHNSQNALAHFNRGLALHRKRDYDRAIQDFDEAIRRQPGSAVAYYLRGAAWHAKRDYDQAIRDYTEALRLKPENAETHVNRGLAWQGRGDKLKAMEDFRAAMRIEPRNKTACEALRRLEIEQQKGRSGGGRSCEA